VAVVLAALANLQSFALAAGADRLVEHWRSASPRFVIYYGTADQAALQNYDIIVLDGDVDAEIVEKYRHHRLLLGYLSLAEVHATRAYTEGLLSEGLLLGPKEGWDGSYYVDLRDPRWRVRVLEQVVPKILQRGFAGLFLDTLDDAAYLERLDPQRYGGMTAAAVTLVHALRERFPKAPLMVNRAYDLLPNIVPDIDMLMGESVHSTYDHEIGSYVRVRDESIRWQRERLLAARRMRADLLLFALDYWTPTDPSGIAALYAENSAAGFIAYVGTTDLTQIVRRP
jgi:uncharacterized protein (TIGR01370 family)